MKARRSQVRENLLKLIDENVQHMVRRRMRGELDVCTELAGWIYNYQGAAPIAEVAAMIVGVAPALDLDTLRDLVHGLVFHRHIASKGHAAADTLADDALRAAGVNMKRFYIALGYNADGTAVAA